MRGEEVEKRVSMINQGEIFGQEDIFAQKRGYSVYSCVNNTIVYSIQKENMLIYQFKSQLKDNSILQS